MRPTVLLAALIAGAVVLQPASAGWVFQGAVGSRSAETTEFDSRGNAVVREHGLLRGVEFEAVYLAKPWRGALTGQVYGDDMAYDGQTQGGVPFLSTTGTRQVRAGIEAGRDVTASTMLIASMELEEWDRHILGRGATLGLREKYGSLRLLGGVQTRTLQTALGSLDLKGLFVLAAPERVNVQFDKLLFDNASLSTRPAVGGRLALRMEPPFTPGVSVELNDEFMRIRRSGDQTLRRNGVPIGTLAQPAHLRQGIGLSAGFRF